MRDALLGLAYLQLQRGNFSRARLYFEESLGRGKYDTQALVGRGVCRFEEAQHSYDPVARERLMTGALADFGEVLRMKPASAEARFNRARLLFETGRHSEARQEIEAYLARDPDSIWATRLREILEKMRLNRSEMIDPEVRRAARGRNTPALEAIVRAVPHSVPAAIRSALLDSLQADGTLPGAGARMRRISSGPLESSPPRWPIPPGRTPARESWTSMGVSPRRLAIPSDSSTAVWKS